MKKAIELLDAAISHIGRNHDFIVMDLIQQAVRELKTPRKSIGKILEIADKTCIACTHWEKCRADLSFSFCRHYEQEFITPIEYEKRTGEPWPDNWAVYARAQYTTGEYSTWGVCNYADAAFTMYTTQIVCANSNSGKPPDGWMPEEVKDQK